LFSQNSFNEIVYTIARKEFCQCRNRFFDYRLTLARRCIEYEFGIPNSKWRLVISSSRKKIPKVSAFCINYSKHGGYERHSASSCNAVIRIAKPLRLGANVCYKVDANIFLKTKKKIPNFMNQPL